MLVKRKIIKMIILIIKLIVKVMKNNICVPSYESFRTAKLRLNGMIDFMKGMLVILDYYNL